MLFINTRGLEGPYFRGLLPEGSSAAYEGPVMGQGITYIGLDVHKRDIRVFAQLPGRKRGAEETISHEPRTVTRWAKRWLREAPGRVVCGYEAGPTGYALQRQLSVWASSVRWWRRH